MSELELQPIYNVQSFLSEVQSMYPDVDLASQRDLLTELDSIAASGSLLLVHEVSSAVPEHRNSHRHYGVSSTEVRPSSESNAALIELDKAARCARIHAVRSGAPTSAQLRFVRRLLDGLENNDTLEWVACCSASDGLSRTLRACGFACRDEILRLWCPPDKIDSFAASRKVGVLNTEPSLCDGSPLHETFRIGASEFSLEFTPQIAAEIKTLIDAVGEQSSDPTRLLRASRNLAHERTTYVVLRHQQRAVGILQVEQATETPPLLSYFGVLPAYRGRGIASRFFSQATKIFTPTLQDGWMVAVASRNVAGLQFFFRHGFQETGRFELLLLHHNVE